MAVAVETSGTIHPEASDLLGGFNYTYVFSTGDLMSYTHLLQRVAVAMQWGNTTAMLGTASSN